MIFGWLDPRVSEAGRTTHAGRNKVATTFPARMQSDPGWSNSPVTACGMGRQEDTHEKGGEGTTRPR
jgi:hypothetical protein